MAPRQGTVRTGGCILLADRAPAKAVLLLLRHVPCHCPYLCLKMQSFLSTLGTAAGSSGGLFAPKPLFWERPAFVIWTAAQPEPAKAEQAWADANNA